MSNDSDNTSDDIRRLIEEGTALMAKLDEDSPSFFPDINRMREVLVALEEAQKNVHRSDH